LLAEVLPQIFFVASLANHLLSKRFGDALLMFLYYVLWFPGIMILEYAKHSSGDFACSSRANGLSGHFFYFAWALSTLILLRDRLRLLAKPYYLERFFAFLVVVFLVQGYFTLFYGYHSLRQALLGALFGTLWAVFSFEVVQVGLRYVK
jgi:hypothetical protein